MRPRISMRGFVRPSVGPSIGWSVRWSVGLSVGPSVLWSIPNAFFKNRENGVLRTIEHQEPIDLHSFICSFIQFIHSDPSLFVPNLFPFPSFVSLSRHLGEQVCETNYRSQEVAPLGPKEGNLLDQRSKFFS